LYVTEPLVNYIEGFKIIANENEILSIDKEQIDLIMQKINNLQSWPISLPNHFIQIPWRGIYFYGLRKKETQTLGGNMWEPFVIEYSGQDPKKKETEQIQFSLADG